MKFKLPCFHDWQYTTAVYGSRSDEMLALPVVPASRTCSKCQQKEHQVIHLLGLNPRSVYSYWEKE